jgi:TonB family protein
MALENKHIIYTAQDIQQYFSGKLAPAEMHAMEKAALEDELLAEAMEGYGGMQDKEWERQLLLLKENFPGQQQAKIVALKPPSRFQVWKLAAAILLICSGVAITYMFTTKEVTPNNSIASIKQSHDSIKSTGIKNNIADTGLTAIAVTPKITDHVQAPAGIEKSTIKTVVDSTFIYRPPTGGRKKQADKIAGGGYNDDEPKTLATINSNNAAPVNNQNNSEQLESINQQRSLTVVPDYKKVQPVLDKKFMAQVLAPDGSPLPFANISVTDQNIGTYADVKGNFKFLSSDSLLNIEIKSAGFLTRNYTLRSDIPQNKIMLSEDINALKGYTQVSGNLSAMGKKTKAALVPDSVINVEPADGWSNYDTYIANNLSLPEEVVQKKIHGEVEISFEVQSNGALTNMKIDKSLCSDCDEAALRVIKDGPRWKVKKGDKATGKIKVKF